MIKKLILLLCFFFALINPTLLKAEQQEDIVSLTRQAGYTVNAADKPASSIVIDVTSGDILWQDRINDVRDPASMSKLFTLYLLFEDIHKGKIALTDLITANQTDQAISQIYEISNNNIVAGVKYPVEDLITMTAVPSSNVATLMLANYMSGNDAGAFIDRINATAKKLGMTNTHFSNASGAVASAFNGHYSPKGYNIEQVNQTTAHDLALLCFHFIKKYPDILNYTNKSSVKTMVGTPFEEEFHSYNYSLPGDKFGLKGVDGLKTGSSPSAAFNAAITAKRGKKRLISIVMGVGDWSDQNGEFYRHPFINAITEKGFSDKSSVSKGKLPNIIRKEKNVHPKKAKAQGYHHETNKNIIERLERFADQHHHFIFLCLGIFMISVLVLGLIAIYK
ncbi:D-alanyl-D-alanine carboxypeptidase [Streptococcus uberis]|nr:D-alanyl-D-alanine carboxypeptidase [Streptococcus uberis]